mmetsp:Transcript_19815/g.47307  ORF Transcript_19815/g.47307 Transcript_19815/m.47307 type:complete len:218 (+) Transcript_19815:14-667(+)
MRLSRTKRRSGSSVASHPAMAAGCCSTSTPKASLPMARGTSRRPGEVLACSTRESSLAPGRATATTVAPIERRVRAGPISEVAPSRTKANRDKSACNSAPPRPTMCLMDVATEGSAAPNPTRASTSLARTSPANTLDPTGTVSLGPSGRVPVPVIVSVTKSPARVSAKAISSVSLRRPCRSVNSNISYTASRPVLAPASAASGVCSSRWVSATRCCG